MRAQKLLRGQKLFVCIWCFLCPWNLFVKKKSRFEMVLIASLTYTTDVYPYQPTYWSFYLHVRIFTRNHPRKSLLFMKIFLNLFCLWESLLFMKICLNLFLLWESFWISSYCVNIFIPFLFVKISFYLWSFVKNLFLFMLICENLFH